MHKNNLIISLILLCGCATTGVKQQPFALTEQQSEYIALLGDMPDKFVVKQNEVDVAWARAQQFITTYSHLELEVSNNHVIATQLPVYDYKNLWGCIVEKHKLINGEYLIRVQYRGYVQKYNGLNNFFTKALALYTYGGILDREVLVKAKQDSNFMTYLLLVFHSFGIE